MALDERMQTKVVNERVVPIIPADLRGYLLPILAVNYHSVHLL